MKIAVLGATGPTGQHFVGQALTNGHHVLALVRNVDKMTVKHENLQVQKADVFSAADLKERLPGCEAVVSCLGYRGLTFTTFFLRTPTTIYSEPMKALAEAMRECDVKRLLCLSSWLLQVPSSAPGRIKVSHTMMSMFLGVAMRDLLVMEDYLVKNCSDLDYTVIRPPQLKDQPKIDGEYVFKEDVHWIDDVEGKMNRENLAHVLLEVLEKDLHWKQIVAVALKK